MRWLVGNDLSLGILFHFATRPGQWIPYATIVERIIRKVALDEISDDVDTGAARLSVEERMNLFEELLRRGEAFYTRDETTEGYPRVYRVVNLRES